MEQTNIDVTEIEVTYVPRFLSFDNSVLKCSLEVYNIFIQLFDPKHLSVREECYALFLNRANRIFGSFKVSSGGITGTVIDIRLVLGIALKTLSTSIIIAHNHPSGNLKPSLADIALTDRLKQAAEVMDIKLLDHLIISPDGYRSLADEGEL